MDERRSTFSMELSHNFHRSSLARKKHQIFDQVFLCAEDTGDHWLCDGHETLQLWSTCWANDSLVCENSCHYNQTYSKTEDSPHTSRHFFSSCSCHLHYFSEQKASSTTVTPDGNLDLFYQFKVSNDEMTRRFQWTPVWWKRLFHITGRFAEMLSTTLAWKPFVLSAVTVRCVKNLLKQSPSSSWVFPTQSTPHHR